MSSPKATDQEIKVINAKTTDDKEVKVIAVIDDKQKEATVVPYDYSQPRSDQSYES